MTTGPNDSIMRSPLEKSFSLRIASVRTILLLKEDIQVWATSAMRSEYFNYINGDNKDDDGETLDEIKAMLTFHQLLATITDRPISTIRKRI